MQQRRSFTLKLPSAVSSSILGDLTLLVDSFTGFGGEYLKANVFSKYVSSDTDPPTVRRHRAISKWLGVELQNTGTNKRLFNSEASFSFGSSTSLLLRAAKIVQNAIGPVPPEDVLFGSFSNGASTSQRLTPGLVARKFTEQADVTRRCWKRIRASVLECETWRLHSDDFGMTPNFVRGNVLFTVPKTTEIDRVACKEPDLNMFAQRGVGNYLRSCLRRKGIDLNDQSINRKLALEGSVNRGLATLDLSSASDTVSTSLVAYLLPKQWFDLLDDLRCGETCIDGVWHENQMFSSMGNGFTFELESLLFWALSKAVCYMTGCKGRVSVYGDDIIVPVSVAPRLAKVLQWCGFKLNSKKSYWRGSFRESCGGHYYGGCDVTPFFLRKPVCDLTDLIHLLNSLRSWAIRTGYDFSNPEIYDFWNRYASLVPKALWGGWDLTSRVQLVSPHASRCVLHQKVKRLHSLELSLQNGLYLASLRRIYERSDAPIEPVESTLSVYTDSWSLRRYRDFSYVFGLVRPLFYQEQ